MLRSIPPWGCARAPALRSRNLRLVIACLALLALATPVAHGQQGRWTPAIDDWNGAQGYYGIHLLLLPEANNPDRSRILWFAGQWKTHPLRGGEWRWGPGNDDCAAVPSTGWTRLTVPFPGADMNLFCTSHAPLGDGRMVFAGGHGHETGEYGENQSRIFLPGSGTNAGTWPTPNPGLMHDWRWYPTTTSLRDGRVLVTGGSRHPHHRVFGGKRGSTTPPASPSWGDTLSRFAPAEGGFWDARVLPAADQTTGNRPVPRYAHSGVEMAKAPDFQAQVYFGGIGSNSQPRNDTWFMTRDDNPLGADYTYKWEARNVVGTPDLPAQRSDHTAVAALGSQMVVFGGLNFDGTSRSDVWRLSKSDAQYPWEQLVVSGTPSPSARCGHGAVYDTTALTGSVDILKRMIVFGGVSAPGQTPTDDKVWELRWDNPSLPNQATWSEMTLYDTTASGPKPAPRYWHSFTQDPRNYIHAPSTDSSAHIAWLYGGALGNNAYSDQLWALWILSDGRVDWQLWTLGPSANPPGPRARHSVTLDPKQGNLEPRLYLFGGENANGVADPYVYKLDPHALCWAHACPPPEENTCPDSNPLCGPTWSRWDDYEYSLSGHTMLLEFSTSSDPTEVAPSRARVAETLDPVALTYQKHASANFYSNHTYPLNFVVPGGLGSGCRVVSVDRGAEGTYYLDIPDVGSAGGWVLRPSQGSGFEPAGAVMYRPGQVMIAGGMLGGSVTGRTRSVNAAKDTVWRSSPDMLARRYQNLVLLPDGKVIAVGGKGPNNEAIKRPQIWDPDASAGVGAWTPVSGAGALAEQAKDRVYHSTAILLQDGRVLSAGEAPTGDEAAPEIFCPPYLFKSDGSSAHALRPAITGAPTSVTYRKVFTVCTPDPTRITRACLIRSGATTHGFDQNQR